jgi:head-tail adaptor
MEKLNQSGAGRLYYRLAFDQREMVDDGYGNVVAGDWTEQFQCRAEFIHLRGSETVMAARLESRNPMAVTVRKNSQTKQIDTDWQARDVRRNVAYNIRDIRENNNRATLDLLLESGVATG